MFLLAFLTKESLSISCSRGSRREKLDGRELDIPLGIFSFGMLCHMTSLLWSFEVCCFLKRSSVVSCVDLGMSCSLISGSSLHSTRTQILSWSRAERGVGRQVGTGRHYKDQFGRSRTSETCVKSRGCPGMVSSLTVLWSPRDGYRRGTGGEVGRGLAPRAAALVTQRPWKSYSGARGHSCPAEPSASLKPCTGLPRWLSGKE